MMKISSNTQSQAAQQTQLPSDVNNSVQKLENAVHSHNPAAEQYGMSSQSAEGDTGPQTYDEALTSLEREVAQKELEIQEYERILGELEYYLENADMTPDQKAAVRDAIINGRALLSKANRELHSRQQTLDSMLTYGSEADWDGDGLTNSWEDANGADKLNIDTDGDGLSDAVERVLNKSGFNAHWNSADTDNNGVTDYQELYGPAADAADALGIDNWDLGPRGGGSSSSPDPFGSSDGDNSSSGSGSTDGSTGPDGSTPPPSVGPEPSDNAHEVDLSGDADTNAEGEAEGASAQSGMGVQTGMNTQEADELAAPDVDTGNSDKSKAEIVDELTGKSYPPEDVITIEEELDASGNSLEDVVLKLGAGDDNVVVEQQGEDLIIYTDEKKIIVKKGIYRKIFVEDKGGIDNFVMYNVSQQVVQGATQAIDGEHSWASGFFVQRNEGNGFNPVSDNVEETAEEESPFGFDEPVTPEPTEDEPVPEPQNAGVDNVYTVWDTFRDENGNPASSGSIGKSEPFEEVMGENGSQWVQENWNLKSGSSQVDIALPETVNGIPVREVNVLESGSDMVIELKDKTGKILKVIKIKNGITNGNTGATDDRIQFKLPDGVNDPKGYYENGYQFGGVKFDASQVESNRVVVHGGAGHDWIIGSNSGMGDEIRAGAGNDIIEAGAGENLLFGDDGDDMIAGGDGMDVIYGGKGNDMIDGGKGSNILKGEAGNDFLVDADGESIVDGGHGIDQTNMADTEKVDGVEKTLDSILDATEHLDDLIAMLDISDEAAQEAVDLIKEWIEEGAMDKARKKIRELFGQMLGIKQQYYWEGGSPPPDTNPAPAEPEEPEGEGGS